MHVEGNQCSFAQTMVPTSMLLPMKFMQSAKRFIPHHRMQNYRISLPLKNSKGTHFVGLWETAMKSMKYHLRRTLGCQFAIYYELCTLLFEKEACVYSGNLCAFYFDSFKQTYLSPGYFLLCETLPQLPATHSMMSNEIVFPVGKPTNNNCNSFGNFGQLSTTRDSNSVNDGRGPHQTYNQAISLC